MKLACEVSTQRRPLGALAHARSPNRSAQDDFFPPESGGWSEGVVFSPHSPGLISSEPRKSFTYKPHILLADNAERERGGGGRN